MASEPGRLGRACRRQSRNAHAAKRHPEIAACRGIGRGKKTLRREWRLGWLRGSVDAPLRFWQCGDHAGVSGTKSHRETDQLESARVPESWRWMENRFERADEYYLERVANLVLRVPHPCGFCK